MATKKQRRAAALAKREAFLETERRIGQEAIEQGKKERDLKALRTKEEIDRIQRRHELGRAVNKVHEGAN